MGDTPAPVSVSGGEHPNGRRAMDDLIRRQRESGVPYETAERKAREAARRHEQRNPR